MSVSEQLAQLLESVAAITRQGDGATSSFDDCSSNQSPTPKMARKVMVSLHMRAINSLVCPGQPTGHPSGHPLVSHQISQRDNHQVFPLLHHQVYPLHFHQENPLEDRQVIQLVIRQGYPLDNHQVSLQDTHQVILACRQQYRHHLVPVYVQASGHHRRHPHCILAYIQACRQQYRHHLVPVYVQASGHHRRHPHCILAYIQACCQQYRHHLVPVYVQASGHHGYLIWRDGETTFPLLSQREVVVFSPCFQFLRVLRTKMDNFLHL